MSGYEIGGGQLALVSLKSAKSAFLAETAVRVRHTNASDAIAQPGQADR